MSGFCIYRWWLPSAFIVWSRFLCIVPKHSANVCLPEFALNVRVDATSNPIRWFVHVVECGPDPLPDPKLLEIKYGSPHLDHRVDCWVYFCWSYRITFICPRHSADFWFCSVCIENAPFHPLWYLFNSKLMLIHSLTKMQKMSRGSSGSDSDDDSRIMSSNQVTLHKMGCEISF